MIFTYRFSFAEFEYLCALYEIESIPSFIEANDQAIPESEIILMLEKKEYILCIEGKYLPSPDISFMFDSIKNACVYIPTDSGFSFYCCKEIIVAMEKNVNSEELRVLPFKKIKDCFEYMELSEINIQFDNAYVLMESEETEKIIKTIVDLQVTNHECRKNNS